MKQFDKVCEDCCCWAYDRGSVEFVREPTDDGELCPTCKGHRYVLTKHGKQLLEFFERWFECPKEKKNEQ